VAPLVEKGRGEAAPDGRIQEAAKLILLMNNDRFHAVNTF
jgi:hypothetical protein